MTLDLTGLKAQMLEGLKELKATELPAEADMPFMVLSRWRAVEAQIQAWRMAVSELVAEPAKDRQRQEDRAAAERRIEEAA